MYILHIETSTAVCSVALSRDRTLVAFQDLEEGMNHTARLAPAISELLHTASIKPTDLAAIAVSSGPGQTGFPHRRTGNRCRCDARLDRDGVDGGAE